MKKILIPLLAFFILAFTASAAGNLTTTNSSFSVVQGFTNSSYITLTNTGNTNLIAINLTAGNLSYSSYTIPSSNLTLGNSSINLITNQSANITINATIPSNTTAGIYTGNIIIEYDNGTLMSLLTLTVVAPSYSFSLPSEINLGTVSQNTTQTTTFLVKNNGNAPLTNVNVSSNAASKYNVAFNQTNIGKLAVGENRTIKLNAIIPYDESGGTKTLGNIYIMSTERNASFPLKATVQGRLEIDDLDVKVDGDTDSNLDDEDTIDKDAKSESEIEFNIKIENGFTDDEDIEIENIQVTITIEDIDDGDDLEEDSSEFDLDAEESKRVKVNFELPVDVEEGDYNVVIHVEGEDEDGNDHELDWTLELKVEKESHEIKIRKASVSPSTVDCTRRTDLNLELMNIGKNEEDEVYYLISNSALGISIREGPFELSDDFDDDNNILKAIHTIYIKDNQAAGTYGLEIRVYYDTDKIDDYKRVDLVVNDCSTTTDDTTDDDTDTTTGDTTGQTTDDTTGQTTTPDITPIDVMPPETTFRDSTSYLALLGLLIIIVIAGIVLAGAYYLSIRRNV